MPAGPFAVEHDLSPHLETIDELVVSPKPPTMSNAADQA